MNQGRKEVKTPQAVGHDPPRGGEPWESPGREKLKGCRALEEDMINGRPGSHRLVSLPVFGGVDHQQGGVYRIPPMTGKRILQRGRPKKKGSRKVYIGGSHRAQDAAKFKRLQKATEWDITTGDKRGHDEPRFIKVLVRQARLKPKRQVGEQKGGGDLTAQSP